MAKVLSDIEIAQQTTLEPITTIAKKVGLTDDDLELYGKYKAKISFDAIKRLSKEKRRQARIGYGHYADAGRRRQDLDDHRPGTGVELHGP